MEIKDQTIEQLAINTVRILSADAVQKANSGHPGMPMGAAPMAHVIYANQMKYNAKSPKWVNRDRFILSAGHGCMLQYSMLYLTGYDDISLDDIKDFRQMHSKTAGHPEYGHLQGIEVTTGPLGQGFANGVGFSIAQKHMAARFNKPGFNLFDYNIYAIVSDGDLQEGVASEAASLAGHLKLGNLIYLYDDNHISIEGDTDVSFTEDVKMRFEAYGWQVLVVTDGNDIDAIAAAVEEAKLVTDKPTLIKVRTHIGFGSPNKVDSYEAHGSPLGVDELKLVKKAFGFNPEESFVIPADVLAFYNEKGSKGAADEAAWNQLYSDYKAAYPALAADYELLASGALPQDWKNTLPVFAGTDKAIATRSASGKVINAIAATLPQMIGGSADLAPSTNTLIDGATSFTADNYGGRNFHFGIREHAMGAIANGMALSHNIIPYCATFLIFSEYMRPPIRLAAIMKIRSIFIYTHDSIGLGEDGTTHQPVEQLISLRSIPNITVLRPADANETAQAWRVALEHTTGPVCLILTRQALPILDQTKYGSAQNVEKGAYIVSDCEGDAQVILLATGSEVSLIMKAQEQLKAEGISSRVVSMPSWELFEKQDSEYKNSVLPKHIKKRVSVEMASTLGWHKYVTDDGFAIGLDRFGESAPAEVLMEEFGFTVANVVAKAKLVIG
ncbi:MAG: transketolase [Sphingobacteriales bacterium]|nr:MAG: transketolase [Sphingobacteriales bacterium]